jgi:hypothetical protein
MKEFIALSYEITSVLSEGLQAGFDEQSRFEQEVGLNVGHDCFLQISSPS